MAQSETEKLLLLLASMPVAAAATAILCTLIIFPMTPPLEFDAAIRTGLRCSDRAVTTCRFLKQRIRRCVAASEEDSQPAEERTEERKQHTGLREREPQ